MLCEGTQLTSTDNSCIACHSRRASSRQHTQGFGSLGCYAEWTLSTQAKELQRLTGATERMGI